MKIIDFIIKINGRIVTYANCTVTIESFDKVNIFSLKREKVFNIIRVYI